MKTHINGLNTVKRSQVKPGQCFIHSGDERVYMAISPGGINPLRVVCDYRGSLPSIDLSTGTLSHTKEDTDDIIIVKDVTLTEE